jgi:hypothetical protein
MHSDFTYLFNVLVGLVSFIGLGVSFIGGFVGLGLVSLSGFSGISGLVGRISLVGRIGLDGIILTSLVGNSGLGGFSGISGLVGRISLVGRIGLNGFIGLCIVSIVGHIGHISLVGLGDFSGNSGLVGQISLVSPIGLIGLIGLISLGNLGITSLVGSSALSARQFIGLIGFVIAAKTISWRLKQAAALRVATLQSSATEIVDVAFYYFASSSLHVCLLVREKMCWWLALARKKMWQWIASFGKSYHGDVLQFGKQLFYVRLLLMTKLFVMRECDNILSGYLCAVTPLFSQQDGIYGFKFPKGFLEISSQEISLFSQLFS